MKGTEISNYADDTSILAYGSNMRSILKSLQEDASLLSLWFENNYMKENGDKSHLLAFRSKDGEVSASILGSLILESDEEKLLGVILNRRLNFKNHVSNLCKVASQKLHALGRVLKSSLALNITSFLYVTF